MKEHVAKFGHLINGIWAVSPGQGVIFLKAGVLRHHDQCSRVRDLPADPRRQDCEEGSHGEGEGLRYQNLGFSHIQLKTFMDPFE